MRPTRNTRIYIRELAAPPQLSPERISSIGFASILSESGVSPGKAMADDSERRFGVSLIEKITRDDPRRFYGL
jgi:hypothetical protein